MLRVDGAVGTDEYGGDPELCGHVSCVRVMGAVVSAGIVTRPREGSETTAGSVGTVYSAIVRDPLSTTMLMTVATTVVTV